VYWFLAGIFAFPAMVASRRAERNRRHAWVRWLFTIDQLPLREKLMTCAIMVCTCLVLGTVVWLIGTVLVPPVMLVYLN